MYFILFDAVANGIAYLLVLIFGIYTLGFTICKIMSSKNRYSFTFFFSIWVPFIPFYFPIFLAKTPAQCFLLEGMGPEMQSSVTMMEAVP